jgi:hypothetical protein
MIRAAKREREKKQHYYKYDEKICFTGCPKTS